LEDAESCADPGRRAAVLIVVVVGGGPTGVEIAGKVAELARYTLRGDSRRIDPAQARVILVEAGRGCSARFHGEDQSTPSAHAAGYARRRYQSARTHANK
jgi:NADH dehydrogenase FAD-containing subunit